MRMIDGRNLNLDDRILVFTPKTLTDALGLPEGTRVESYWIHDADGSIRIRVTKLEKA